ncbi:MAG: hypothetical protein ABI539_07615 [Acidobacteriota bacterium]
MTNEENVTITQTAPDGTETVIEITQTKPEAQSDADGGSLVEEVIDALFDDGGDDTDLADDLAEQDEILTEASDVPAGIETETETADTLFSDTAADQPELIIPVDYDAGTEQVPFTASSDVYSPVDAGVYGTADTVGSAAAAEEAAAEASEAQAHADAAGEAQRSADEFVEAGDYAAAAEARGSAEDEAFAAADNSVLHGSDSTDLDNAAYQQENADFYEARQAEHAAAGDYEAAKEDAINAGYAQGDADFQAGGADHTGQAAAEENQMDWAVWEQNNAESFQQSADQYAAEGDLENAEMYAADAAEHQEMADYHGDLGEHGGDMAVYDPSSEVASGGSFDAPDAADYSAVDTSATDYSTE